MAPASPSGKRIAADEPISPPPLKRAVQSSTTKTAVANFFTPTSQKPKERTVWTERGPNDDVPATLLVGRYEPEEHSDTATKRLKIAAFDLDSTLISTSSGKKHARNATDWKWWHKQVPGRLRELYRDEGYRVIILSNQAGIKLRRDPNYKGPRQDIKKVAGDFKQKCNAILTNLDIPTTIFAATEKDYYRKPNPGMWKEVCNEYDIPEEEVDIAGSFYVGDAGGRTACVTKGEKGLEAVGKDFSCSDRNLAHNVGIDFKTPEEFFLDAKPRDFVRDFDLTKFPYMAESTPDVVYEKSNAKDIVLFSGPPGAGKSTFYWKFLKPLGYERVNQDLLKSREKCIKVARELIEEGKSIVVDNTNADPDTRSVWIDVAKRANVPIRCVWFRTPLQVCEHNDGVRSLNKALNPEDRERLPKMAFSGFAARHREPKVKEGFQDVIEVDFKFRGTRDEYDSWGRYCV